MNLKKSIRYIRNYGLRAFISTHMDFKGQTHKHVFLQQYLEKDLISVINEYKSNSEPFTERSNLAQKTIWVLWWEGVEEMPEIVRYCFDSIKLNSGNYDVIMLTKKNYLDYVFLPAHIIQRFNEGCIDIVHMADIIRVFLLSENGGVWLDATVFLSSPLPDEYTNVPFYSRKSNGQYSKFASSGKWGGYFMATSHTHTLLFEYLKNAYNYYWKKHNIIIDYFLLDYLILIAYKHYKPVKKIIDEVQINNPEIKVLSTVLNLPYEESKWNEMSNTTSIFKLSWKTKLIDNIGGKDTFYKVIVKNENNN